MVLTMILTIGIYTIGIDHGIDHGSHTPRHAAGPATPHARARCTTGSPADPSQTLSRRLDPASARTDVTPPTRTPAPPRATRRASCEGGVVDLRARGTQGPVMHDPAPLPLQASCSSSCALSFSLRGLPCTRARARACPLPPYLQVQHWVVGGVALHAPQRDALVLADARLDVLALRTTSRAGQCQTSQQRLAASPPLRRMPQPTTHAMRP
jgi:hypothetical protein